MSSLSKIQAHPLKQGIMEITQPQDKSSTLPKITPPNSLAVVPTVVKEHSYTQIQKTLNPITISQIFYDVYASHTQLPTYIQRVIRDYVPEETASILERPFLRAIPAFSKLTDPAVLKTYLGAKYKGPEYISKALEIVKRIYEAEVRPISSPKFGLAFPMNPEILAHMMDLVKEEEVLEIGGASGENALLMAFTDAKKIYFNEIDEVELGKFHALRNQLPVKVRNKLEAIPGNCLHILQKRPALKGQIGLIVCKNLIHFFNDQQQEEFFKVLHALLKPGGRVMLMVNATYAFPQHRQFFEENAQSSSFTQTLCLVDASGQTSEVMVNQFDVCSPDKVSLNYRNLFLYERNVHTGFKWQVDNELFRTLDPDLRIAIKNAFNTNKAAIKKIKQGSVRVLISTLRAYSKENLLSLCATYGLDAESIFVVGKDGHLLKEDEELEGKANLVGIICKKPK